MDWKKIKAEYIAGGTSYRKLVEKYGVPFTTLVRIAQKENWVGLREQAQHKAETKLVDVVSTKEANRADKIINAADQILDRICAILPLVENPTGLRDLTTALKNLRDIKGIKSDADMREQEARIRNLEKQAEDKKVESSDIVITMPPELEEYSK